MTATSLENFRPALDLLLACGALLTAFVGLAIRALKPHNPIFDEDKTVVWFGTTAGLLLLLLIVQLSR